ncbi:MAG: hypothetical protein NVSMB42_19340 [Herpetosiphon sp.]
MGQAPRKAAPGRWLDGSYAGTAGTRTYKLYIPTGYREQRVPLVVMLHGCTQNPDDFATGTGMNEVAEEHTMLVVYIEQPGGANRGRCWNWFQPDDQSRNAGEPSIIAGLTEQLKATYHVDPERIYLGGMSAGGAMAVIMAATYPDLYAAVGVHSGLPYRSAHDVASAFKVQASGQSDPRALRTAAERSQRPGTSVVPMIVFHGDADTTVNRANADQVINQWVGLQDTSGTSDGAEPRITVSKERPVTGHPYTCTVYRDVRGQVLHEKWLVHGMNHAWSGGHAPGSFTDAAGPDASREMVRFWQAHPKQARR